MALTRPMRNGSKAPGRRKADRVSVENAYVDPFKNPVLSAYLASVRDWHGYIRFLGLPHLRENPDVPIDRLYVAPYTAARPVPTDAEAYDRSGVESLVDTVCACPRLVLLGDPGSGKSTLVSWLAWHFAQPSGDEWTHRLGRLVPVPMVLRELRIGRGIDWPGLLAAFCKHEMAKPLRGTPHLQELLARGQALIMLDGLDEIGNVSVRAALRDAVLNGMEKFPDCRWVLTSRSVGYEDAPFDRRPAAPETEPAMPTKAAAARRDSSEKSRPRIDLPEADRVADVRYVAPFTDGQIERFSRNWYALRESVPEVAETRARNLIQALHNHKSTLRLARVPNLLTMMALIHRVRARLPNGRAMLFEDITEAYLESIDEFRSLLEVDFPLAQKKRWLSRVGFEMQCRRVAAKERDSSHFPSEILVSEADVKAWITEAMGESGYGGDEKTASAFIDYIARRSGLLLPRGAGRFAFMHLSLQEYFAAGFLAEEITSPYWLTSGTTTTGADRKVLRGYTRDTGWQETLIFLFELLADKTGWPKTLAALLFGENFRDATPGKRDDLSALVLLARLAVNPHSGFSQDMRRHAAEICGAAAIKAMQDWAKHGPVIHANATEVAGMLFAPEPGQESAVRDTFIGALRKAKATRLFLTGTGVTDLRPLAKLSNLERLDLDGTGVTDLGPLAKLSNLVCLNLNRTGVTDLGPLAQLSNLETLYLYGTGVTNLRPLAKLSNLETLNLNGTGVTNLRPLAKLSNLESLYLDETGVTDLGPLAKLSNLGELRLNGTAVTD